MGTSDLFLAFGDTRLWCFQFREIWRRLGEFNGPCLLVLAMALSTGRGVRHAAIRKTFRVLKGCWSLRWRAPGLCALSGHGAAAFS